jgi:hypothetical protein
MTTPPNKEAQEWYYLSEDGLTIYDREVFCHGDGPIFEDDSLCVFENKGRAKKVLELLNSHSTESAERERLIERLEVEIADREKLLLSHIVEPDIAIPDDHLMDLYKDLLHHLRGNEND